MLSYASRHRSPLALTVVLGALAALVACSGEPSAPIAPSDQASNFAAGDVITVTNTSGGTEWGSLRWAVGVTTGNETIRFDPESGRRHDHARHDAQGAALRDDRGTERPRHHHQRWRQGSSDALRGRRAPPQPVDHGRRRSQRRGRDPQPGTDRRGEQRGVEQHRELWCRDLRLRGGRLQQHGRRKHRSLRIGHRVRRQAGPHARE